MAKNINDIAKRLAMSISDDVGNGEESEIQSMMSDFDKILDTTLKGFSSSNFSTDGIIERLQSMTFDERTDKETLKKILGGVKTDYADTTSITDSDMMLRRDISNICEQMPEMRDVIYIVRDSIIETDVVTGNVSRTFSFADANDDEQRNAKVLAIEDKFNLLMAIKNFCIPQALTVGEMYINVVPYKRLFAEVQAASDKFHGRKSAAQMRDSKHQSTKSVAKGSSVISEHCIFSEENVRILKESVTFDTSVDAEVDYRIEQPKSDASAMKDINHNSIAQLLKNIDVYPEGTSVMMSELGPNGLMQLLQNENVADSPEGKTFFEDVLLDRVAEEDIDPKRYSDIKGCYVKYLDPLRVVTIRMGQKPAGYCYVTTSMDLQTNPTQPNGVIDLTFQHYAKDRNMVANLANLIIKSFDRPMLDRNIELKSEIADIIMEHRFNEGRLSFLYLPENEVIRLVVNEDEIGRGHSIIEPSLFPARMYLMLTLYNMIYIMNNTTTRVHYLRSSGLNKDYSAQVQRAMRKFQSRRVTIDDIHSYSGVLNKIGGIGEMVLPSGRGDYKALETDTIPAVDAPINMEFLELKRREAISGTGVPALMIINAIDEIEFAKSLEVANTRFLSTVSSYKIDFNRGFTKVYQEILRYTTDLSDDEIAGFRFKFNSVRQPMLEATNAMIQNFNTIVETVGQIYYSQDELQTPEGKATELSKCLRRELAEEYLPQFDYDQLDKLAQRAKLRANEATLQQRVNADGVISNDELQKIGDPTTT